MRPNDLIDRLDRAILAAENRSESTLSRLSTVEVSMRFKSAFLSLLAMTCVAQAEVVPGSQFSHGNWSGAGYTDDYGSFSHCAISTSYVSGNVLIFTVNIDATVNVAVSAPVETFMAEETFPVALIVDRRAPFYGNATAMDQKFAAVNIADFDRALESFRRGRTLVIQSKYGEVPFDLTGTSRALAATFDCAVRNQYYRSTPPQPTSVQVDPALLMQVAAGNITNLGVTDFTFLSAQEVAELFPDSDGTIQSVFWRSARLKMLSGVLVAQRAGATDLKAGDASDLAFLSGICGGDFVTGVRQIATEGREMREVRAACSSSGDMDEHYLTKFFFGDKIVYSWLWFEGADTNSSAMPSRDELSESSALHTASYLAD